MSPHHVFQNVTKHSKYSDFNKYFNPTSLTKTHIGSRMQMGPKITQFSGNKSNIEKCPHRHISENFKKHYISSDFNIYFYPKASQRLI